jgi:hypothetical protein
MNLLEGFWESPGDLFELHSCSFTKRRCSCELILK